MELSGALAEQIYGIGPVRYLHAPNLYHHLFLKQWQEHDPDAQVIGPQGLAEKRPGFASLRCGTLDRSTEIVPAAHLWVSSKQEWVTLPDGVPALTEQPRTQDEWLALVGPAAQ